MGREGMDEDAGTEVVFSGVISIEEARDGGQGAVRGFMKMGLRLISNIAD